MYKENKGATSTSSVPQAGHLLLPHPPFGHLLLKEKEIRRGNKEKEGGFSWLSSGFLVAFRWPSPHPTSSVPHLIRPAGAGHLLLRGEGMEKEWRGKSGERAAKSGKHGKRVM